MYAIQEVYNNTNMPTTLVQNGSSSGSGGGLFSSVTGAVGVHGRLPSQTPAQFPMSWLSMPCPLHNGWGIAALCSN